jgi:flavin-dependent dehydrogenase
VVAGAGVNIMNPSTHQCDVLVIGAGPAGASAALTLLNHTNLSVALVEQSDFQKVRIGESVSASLFSIIEHLQIGVEQFGNNCFIPTQGNTAYWGSEKSANRHAIFSPNRATYQVNRDIFDVKLIETIFERQGTVFPRTKCKEITRDKKGMWQVKVNHVDHGELHIQTKYLIDASGRNSSISKWVGASVSQLDNLVGIGAFFKFSNKAELEKIQLMESDETGWWYSATLSEDTVIATYFTDADLMLKKRLNRVSNWQQQLSHSQYMTHRLSGGKATSQKLWVRPAGTHFNNFSKVPNYIPIGDSACSFDPISSMGLGFAMTSGCQAAAIIANTTNQITYDESMLNFQNDLTAQFDHYMTLKQQFYQKEQRWPNSDFWHRRHVSAA